MFGIQLAFNIIFFNIGRTIGEQFTKLLLVESKQRKQKMRKILKKYNQKGYENSDTNI